MTVVLFRLLRFFFLDEREAVGDGCDDGCDAGSMSGREGRGAGVCCDDN